jgi:hypothetical protein
MKAPGKTRLTTNNARGYKLIMKADKTAAITVAAVLFFLAAGCATTEGKKIKSNEFQSAIGAVCVLAGMGAGAYAGVSIAGGNDRNFISGAAGGLLGAAAAGGIYWLILNLAGEKDDADSGGNTPVADEKLLLPKDNY